jgi:predicted transcriptional regulator
MSIANLCHREVMTILESNSVAEAARVMRYQHVGFLVVIKAAGEGDLPQITGVLTDRDIVIGAISKEADLKLLKVRDVMTRDPLLVNVDSPFDAALRHMRDSGVRRAPVVSSDGKLMGVLSMDDVVQALANHIGCVASTFVNERRNEVVTRT